MVLNILILLAIFILECLLKIIGKGFVVHKNSYLRDWWNIIDFIIVLTAIIEFLPLSSGTTSLRGIRALRAIRPLRSINAIPSMKKLVKILLKSLPNLVTVVLLLAFMMLMFGILGLQFFEGSLYYRCRTTPIPMNSTYWPILEGYNYLCRQDPDTCPTGSYCGHPSDHNISLEYENVTSTKFMQYGIVQFDNIGTSFLTVFQVLTIFGWSEIMYNYNETTNEIFSAFFFSTLVLFGAFFLLNLILAVIIDAYNKIDMKEKKKDEQLMEMEAKKREKKFEALKTMYKMMRLSQKKKELIESAGMKYRWSFFDVVFELVRIERYEKVINPRAETRLNRSIKELFKKKIEASISLEAGKEDESPGVKKMKSLQNELVTIVEKQEEEDDDEEQKKQSSNNIFSSLSGIMQRQKSGNNLTKKKMRVEIQARFRASSLVDQDETIFCLNNADQTRQEESFSVLNKSEQLSEMESPVPKFMKTEREITRRVESVSKLTLMRGSQSNLDIIEEIKAVGEGGDGKEGSFENSISSVSSIVQAKSKDGVFYRLQQRCLIIIQSKLFQNLMSLLIVGNTVTMTLDRYPISKEEESFENIANFVFYICFIIEMFTKQIGLGLKGYFKDGFNIFDGLIILISTIDITLNTIFNNSSSTTLSVLRGFRILRLLKIAKSQSKMKDFQQTISKTLRDLRNFSILLFLVVFTYTLLALEFFAYKMKFDENDKYDLENGVSPRLNFDGFVNAFATVFCILQGESYHYIMYNVARSVGKGGILFFVTLIVIGQIILLKLFLAVLLENFEDKRKEKVQEEAKHKNDAKLESGVWKRRAKIFFMRVYERFCPLCLQESESENQNDKDLDDWTKLHGKSLLMFSKESKFRLLSQKVIRNRVFDYFILFLIFASSVLMTIENPLQSRSSQKFKVIYYCDMIISVIFAFEILLKVFTYGLLFNGPNSYLKSIWNVIDVLIVFVSLLSILEDDNRNQQFFQFLRMVRVLRPLRVIGRIEGLKLAIQTMLMAFPHLMNVLLVSFIFYLIFGIFCVNFLKGQFYRCYFEQLEESEMEIDKDLIVTKYDCLNIGGEWVNQNFNFDNTFNAMQMLYTMSSVSWNFLIFSAIDATGINLQPKVDSNKWWMLYFIIFMIIFAFFLLNLFVGVVVSTFNTEKERLGRNFLLTDTQREWLKMKMMLLNTKPVIRKVMTSSNWVRRTSFLIIMHPAFEWFIFGCIIANTLALTIRWHEMDDRISAIVTIFNYFFASIFTIEALLKIIALGKSYFKENWNIFDLIIVIATIVGVIIDFTTSANVGGKATIARSLRVARLFRIVKRAKVLKIITDTLIVTLPSLINVGGLLLLIIYIYAMLGMQLFAFVKGVEGINQRANFQSFGRSFLTLIRMATGEGWDAILQDLTKPFSIVNQCDYDFDTAKYEQSHEVNGCGVRYLASIYIFSFNLIVSVIFLNLFVAIVLQSFEEMNKKENKLLSDANMDKLRHCWAFFDKEGTFFIKIPDFIPFLTMLGEPLGFTEAQKQNLKQQDDFMKHLELPTYNKIQHFYYYDVIQMLTQYAYLKLEAEKKLKQQLMQQNFNFDQLNVEVLASVKEELDFRSDIFKQKNVLAFREAMDKEQRLFKKMGIVKDDLDSSHFWAGDKIRNMQGKAQFNFKGGLQSKQEEKQSPDSQVTEEKKVEEEKGGEENKEEDDAKTFIQIRKESNQRLMLFGGGLDSTKNRRKSLWGVVSQVMTPDAEFEGTILDLVQTPDNGPLKQNDESSKVAHKQRKSSILFPMIQRNAAELHQLGNIQEVEKSSDSPLSQSDPSEMPESQIQQTISENSDLSYNIYSSNLVPQQQHFKQPKQKNIHVSHQQKSTSSQIAHLLHPQLLAQLHHPLGAIHKREFGDTFESRAHKIIKAQKNRKSSYNHKRRQSEMSQNHWGNTSRNEIEINRLDVQSQDHENSIDIDEEQKRASLNLSKFNKQIMRANLGVPTLPRSSFISQWSNDQQIKPDLSHQASKPEINLEPCEDEPQYFKKKWTQDINKAVAIGNHFQNKKTQVLESTGQIGEFNELEEIGIISHEKSIGRKGSDVDQGITKILPRLMPQTTIQFYEEEHDFVEAELEREEEEKENDNIEEKQ